MSHKITFNMISPICFIDRPVFDSIIARCVNLDKFGRIYGSLKIEKGKIFKYDNIFPIKKHKEGYHLSSIMYFENATEFIGSWKKRWRGKYDNLADFGKQKRKIRITAGKYKSYDMPLNLFNIKKIWFYFEVKEVKNVKEIEYLLNKYLVGIGKKVSQGYGWFDSFKIEISEKDFEKELLRPIPIEKTKLSGIKKYTAWCSPYWETSNFTLCKYPE